MFSTVTALLNSLGYCKSNKVSNSAREVDEISRISSDKNNYYISVASPAVYSRN